MDFNFNIKSSFDITISKLAPLFKEARYCRQFANTGHQLITSPLPEITKKIDANPMVGTL